MAMPDDYQVEAQARSRHLLKWTIGTSKRDEMTYVENKNILWETDGELVSGEGKTLECQRELDDNRRDSEGRVGTCVSRTSGVAGIVMVTPLETSTGDTPRQPH